LGIMHYSTHHLFWLMDVVKQSLSNRSCCFAVAVAVAVAVWLGPKRAPPTNFFLGKYLLVNINREKEHFGLAAHARYAAAG